MYTPLVAEREQGAGVEEEVRRLVARELHDRVAQTLTGMLVDVENFKSEQVEWHDVLRQLETIQSSTRQVLASIRQMLHDLRGEDLLRGGLVDSLRTLVTRFQEKTGIAAELDVRPGWPEALNPSSSINLYRIVEEALTNARMHSGARTVRVVLEPSEDEQLAVSIKDDGIGLDMDPGRQVGLGTLGMRERAVFVGGHLEIYGEPGLGTSVRAVFPRALLEPIDSSLPSTELIREGLTA